MNKQAICDLLNARELIGINYATPKTITIKKGKIYQNGLEVGYILAGEAFVYE